MPQDLERILYLDADTIVMNPLKELYETDFEGNYYGVATHVKKVLYILNEIRLNIKEDEPYINTGVLLINLKALRSIHIKKEVKEFIEKNEKELLLLDIVSIYGDKIKLVDSLKYNLGERTVNTYNINHPQKPIGLKWICRNTFIIHYFCRNKPWNKQYIGRLDCFYHKIEKWIRKHAKDKVLILSCGTGGGDNSAAKAYREKYDKNTYKEKLEFDVDKKYVLILTGSMGYGNITDMIKKLHEEMKQVYFVVSYGHNEELFHVLKKEYKNTKNIVILPFTDKISDYMKASDVILSKPGGLTTTEIATLRKPFILTMPISSIIQQKRKVLKSLLLEN